MTDGLPDPRALTTGDRTDAEFQKHHAAWHAHLDACERCAREPFNLCIIGLQLLAVAAVGPEQSPQQRARCACPPWSTARACIHLRYAPDDSEPYEECACGCHYTEDDDD